MQPSLGSPRSSVRCPVSSACKLRAGPAARTDLLPDEPGLARLRTWRFPLLSRHSRTRNLAVVPDLAWLRLDAADPRSSFSWPAPAEPVPEALVAAHAVEAKALGRNNDDVIPVELDWAPCARCR